MDELEKALGHAKQGEWDAVFTPGSAVLEDARVNATPGSREYNLLHHALWWGDCSALRSLIARSGSVLDASAKTSKGQSPLHILQRHPPELQRQLRSLLTDHVTGGGTPHGLRVMTFNAYLIPGWLVDSNNATCTRQAERATRAGELVAQRADVACLQEMWGSSVGCFEAATLRSMEVVPPAQRGYGVTLLDTLAYFARQTGGLYATARSAYPMLHHRSEKFASSNTKSQKGVSLAVLDVSLMFPEAPYLAVFNTHLDPTNENGSQERQIRQLNGFIGRCVGQHIPEGVPGFSLGGCAVLITGDMNINSNAGEGSPVYAALVGGRSAEGQVLSVRDVHREWVGGGHTTTYCSRENSLATWGVGERLDYILAVDSVNGTPAARVSVRSVEVLKQPAGQELSDHWPVVAEFDVTPS
eukprot:TRINITY_DN1774_c1_g1_i1.p1 TRINITY_DN1774_c1_g1~~TRINITY_DN1774_c1_g1_i1.p1  ORF type:complete len:442 (+),score=128.85 TRINITY_DN1774_c1_g1_i1:86-1327(+)